mmetsp:Transcript_45267/g.54476  ORF Transcript_45267/g.54476 Transcript_45267/m.54476 type:complete len:199 (-) Transcript_45267:502-1098(-)
MEKKAVKQAKKPTTPKKSPTPKATKKVVNSMPKKPSTLKAKKLPVAKQKSTSPRKDNSPQKGTPQKEKTQQLVQQPSSYNLKSPRMVTIAFDPLKPSLWEHYWDDMKNGGWTHQAGKGLINDCFVFPGKSNSGVPGIDFIIDMYDVMVYAKANLGWIPHEADAFHRLSKEREGGRGGRRARSNSFQSSKSPKSGVIHQ